MFVSDTVRKKKLLSLSFTYTLILLIWENKEMSMMQHCGGIGGKLLSEMSIENQYEYLMHLSLSRLCKAPVNSFLSWDEKNYIFYSIFPPHQL